MVLQECRESGDHGNDRPFHQVPDRQLVVTPQRVQEARADVSSGTLDKNKRTVELGNSSFN